MSYFTKAELRDLRVRVLRGLVPPADMPELLVELIEYGEDMQVRLDEAVTALDDWRGE